MSDEPKYQAQKGEIDQVLPEHAIGRIVYQVGSGMWEIFSRDDLEESYTIKCRRSGVVVAAVGHRKDESGKLTNLPDCCLIQTHGVLPSTRVSGDIAAATEAGLLGSLKILYPEGTEPDETEEADESQPQY